MWGEAIEEHLGASVCDISLPKLYFETIMNYHIFKEAHVKKKISIKNVHYMINLN